MVDFEPEIDCFAFKSGDCMCLKDLCCSNKKCAFYKSNLEINSRKIESDILHYPEYLKNKMK